MVLFLFFLFLWFLLPQELLRLLLPMLSLTLLIVW